MAIEGASGGNANNIRAGGATVEIGGDTSLLKRSLDRAKSMVKGVGGWLQGLGGIGAKGGLLAGIGLVAGYKELKDILTESVDKVSGMKRLASTLGTSVEEASKLAYAFKTIGIESEELEHLGMHLQKSIVEAAAGKGELTQTFRELGIDARALLGKPFEEQMQAVADAIMSIQNPAIQMTVAMEMFGKKGIDAIKMFRKGLSEAKKEAEEMGFVISKDMADKASDFKKSMRILGEVFEGTFLQIGAAMMPPKETLKEFVGEVQGAVAKVREFLTQNSTAAKILSSLGMGVVATSAALLVFKKTIGLIGSGLAVAIIPLKIAFAAVGTAITLVGTLLGALLTPIGLVVAAVGGLTAMWMTQTESGKQFTSETGQLFADLADTAKTAWGGIVDAIKAGNLELAGEIAFKGLQVAWQQMIVFLQRQWNHFKDFLLDSIEKLRSGVAHMIAEAGTGAIKVLKFLAPELNFVPGLKDSDLKLIDEASKEDLHRNLIQMENEKRKAAHNARDADLEREIKELERLKAELRGRVDRAAGERRAKDAAAPKKSHVEEEIQKSIDALKPAIADSVKGGFSVMPGQFEFGDDVKLGMIKSLERSAKAAERSEQIQKSIQKAVEALPDQLNGLVFA